jgi:UDP-glucose 4-epimerase
MDLAEGHLAALKYMDKEVPANEKGTRNAYSVFNLGSGNGLSVLDLVEAMKAASGRLLPYEFAPRREGDIAVCYADTTKAREVLGWTATRTVQDMCASAWKWQSSNPNGYASAADASCSK